MTHSHDIKPTEKQVEGLRELINIGVGRGASVLNTMLQSHIHLEVPKLKILTPQNFKNEVKKFGENRLAAVELDFKGLFSGTAQLVFPAGTASSLVTTLIGEGATHQDMDSLQAGTLTEIGNIVLNGVIGSIANVLKLRFEYSVPTYLEETMTVLFRSTAGEDDLAILLAQARFIVEKLNIDGDILLFFEVGALDKLLRAINAL